MSAVTRTLASDADFLAGRDLAVRMLAHMQGIGDGDHASIEAKYRYDGQPQDNLAMDYLLQLLGRPALAEGFGAVLSDGFFTGGFADADLYGRLSIGEMRSPKQDAAFQLAIRKIVGGA